jgi:hypothetical protein
MRDSETTGQNNKDAPPHTPEDVYRFLEEYATW